MIDVLPPGRGEIIGDAPDRRVEILSDRDPVHATLSRFASGREGADLHVHRRHTDFFYVLEGELTVRLGGEDNQVTVPAGSLAWVPPDVVHGFRNAGSAQMRYVNFHAPGMRFADYLRALRDGVPFSYDQHDPPDDGGRPSSEAVVSAGEPIADGVELLADVPALRVTRVRGAAQRVRAEQRLASYFVLEGDVLLTAEETETRATAGSWIQVPPGLEHTVEGTYLSATAPWR